ncbi:MAG: hypothetical protein E7345_05175 [Clostridiales bacterium]|nr:hypothetical protein [Clostridiales bacterium]
MGLSKEQQLFIDTYDKNILVSASAGSGKTFSMIKKLADILVNKKVPITSLLVVTYTNSAGSEIKVKLFDELSKRIYEEQDESLRDYLKLQLDNINNAEIGTIHSICKKLIKKYFYELGISPDFKLLEEERKYYLDNAIKNVFRKHIEENDDNFYELYSCYDNKRNDESLKSIILKIYDYKNTKNNYACWKEDFLSKSYSLEVNKNIACDYVYKYLQSELSQKISSINDLIARCVGEFEKYSDFLYDRLRFIEEYIGATNFEQSVKIFNNKSLRAKPRLSSSAPIEIKQFDEEVKLCNDDLKKLLDKIKKLTFAENIECLTGYLSKAKNNLMQLLTLVEEVEENYANIKLSKNGLDFNDLENYMLKLLEIDSVRDVLKNSYTFVFVDEYQDVNDKQEAILLNLTSHNNYIMIGDVKQSIYKFRNSSPKIFLEKYKKFNNSNDDIVIKFNLNFRSDNNILSFANEIFSKLITENTIGIDYKNDAMFQCDKDYNDCFVNLNILNLTTKFEDRERAECLAVAKEINRIKTLKKANGEYFENSDIAILLRSRGNYLKCLCETLNEVNIPFTTNTKTSLFETAEVNLLISILKVISNYKNDIPLAIVLKNLFNIDESELYEIKNSSKEKYFHQALWNYLIEGNLLNKINLFKSFLQSGREKLANTCIYDFLQNTIQQFGLIVKYQIMPDGEEKVDNINEFLKLTENENYKYNVDKFLEYLDFISSSETDHVLGDGGDAIRITTMHSSKGLEYPAVIIGGFSKEFQINKDKKNVIISDNFGVAISSIDNEERVAKDTIVKYACELDNKKSQLDEEIRLLYVALTRPREILSIVGTYDLKKLSTINNDIYSSSSYMEMFFKCLENDDLIKFEKDKEFTIFSGDGRAKVNIYNEDEIVLKNKENNESIILNDFDKDLEFKFKQVWGNTPSLEKFTIKNTVTNILNEEKDYENLNNKPINLNESDEKTPKNYLEIGTAYHLVMENLNFTESGEDVELLIDRLISSGEMSPDVAQYVNVNEIIVAIENLKDIVLHADKVYREKQFIMQENYNKLVKNSDNNTKVIIQGIIDMVVVNGNENYLIDFKTNRTNNVEILKSQYKLQLDIYKLAFEKATNIKITKKFLYSFYLGKLIEIE